jgi:phage protein U
MTKPLFQLGDFQFDLPNGVPQTLDHSADYRWEEQGRILRDPAQQFVGPGSQTINLDGVMFPGFSGRQSSMEQLRTIARQGKPVMLTDGLGKVYGKWAIKTVRESKGTFAPGGGARQIEFNVQLVFYGEDNPGQAASPLSVNLGSGFIGGLTQSLGDTSFTGAGSAFGALDWSQTAQFQGLTQQATGSGFNLGQLASIATTGASLAGQLSSGDYVNTALTTFGLLGFDASKAQGWQQLGINAASLAQSYVNRQGASGMAVALDAVARLGAPRLVEVGVIAPQDAPAVGTLLSSAATVGTVLTVDPKITNALQTVILQ